MFVTFSFFTILRIVTNLDDSMQIQQDCDKATHRPMQAQWWVGNEQSYHNNKGTKGTVESIGYQT